MVRRIASLLLLAWALGFGWFAMALPQPHDGGRTDGVVVLTGGEGRIARGLASLRRDWARKMLVSGVDRDVRVHEFALEYGVRPNEMACCVTLGYDAVDTRSNATEAARWIERRKLRSVRLVTTDWHMRRAAHELEAELPNGIAVVRDAVPSQPTLKVLFREYHKLLASIVARWAA